MEIVFNKRISPDIFLMGLKSPEIVREAEPGQFVMLRVGRGLDPLLRRPFTICSTQGEDRFLLLYKAVGRGTDMMATFGAGQSLCVLGPLGRGFEIPAGSAHHFLVAGGIGIAPLIFLAQHMEKQSTIFMAGFKTADEMIDLEAFGVNDIRCEFSTEDGTAGYHGLVTDLLESHLSRVDTQKTAVFGCGPQPMMKKMATLSAEQRFPCQLSLEATMACGLGVCQGCALQAAGKENSGYVLVCRNGPVFEAESLNWKVL